jgi:hypothetical protein
MVGKAERRQGCLNRSKVPYLGGRVGEHPSRTTSEVGEDQTAEIREKVKKEIAMKHFTVLLIAVLVFNSVAVTQATQAQGASQAAKAKAEVQRRGTGEKSRVKVRLRNKAEVKGYISKIEDTSFDVTDKKTGTATTIPYANAEKVQGSGLSKGAKIGIIAGAAVVTVAVVIAVAVCRAGYC